MFTLLIKNQELLSLKEIISIARWGPIQQSPSRLAWSTNNELVYLVLVRTVSKEITNNTPL